MTGRVASELSLGKKILKQKRAGGILIVNHIVSSHQILDFPKSNCVENDCYISSVTAVILVLQVHKAK